MATKENNPEADREPKDWKKGGNDDNKNKSYRDYVQQGDEKSKPKKKDSK